MMTTGINKTLKKEAYIKIVVGIVTVCRLHTAPHTHIVVVVL